MNQETIDSTLNKSTVLKQEKEIFYCIDCFAYTEEECFCNKIIGYDPTTGYPIVSVTDDEWYYLYGPKDNNEDAE